MSQVLKRPYTVPYRADIDGLRAIAVLLVLLDHLQIWHFAGGYVGVDVFFVISGYLISSSILADMNSGRFSIVGFYERRVRRIFPALLGMAFIATVLAYRYLVPAELVNYGKSLLASLGSVSNIFFWLQSGYFDGPSLRKPLLHTWSLAVEEQFYVFFPIFLVTIRRLMAKRQREAIWTVTGISFALSTFWVYHNASTAFYSAPLRAWELLLGTIVSQRYLPVIERRFSRHGASIAGILCILVPAALYTGQTRFPGLLAFPPCLGAALLIAAGETGPSLAGRILAWRPIVFVGLISYSLYLWHWPILVFQRTSEFLVESNGSDRQGKIAVLLSSFLFATISWRFVETPFRKGRLRLRRSDLFATAFAGCAVLATCAAFFVESNGVPKRLSPTALQVAKFVDYEPVLEWREGSCFLVAGSRFKPDQCLQGTPGPNHYLLIGDSTAAQLYPGLTKSFPQLNFSQVNVASCPLMLSVPDRMRSLPNCLDMAHFVFDRYLPLHPVDTVLIAGGWQPNDLPDLGQTIEWIRAHGMKVVVFGPTDLYRFPLPQLLLESLRKGGSGDLDGQVNLANRSFDNTLRSLTRNEGVPYISMYDEICGPEPVDPGPREDGCPVYAAPGIPMFFDSHHLTPEGSMVYAEAIRKHRHLPLELR
ncbi:acyltransferase [Acidobacteria bacterium AB60]|nr:acyltransferase [Acidobacteria bacterium AB60]